MQELFLYAEKTEEVARFTGSQVDFCLAGLFVNLGDNRAPKTRLYLRIPGNFENLTL